MSQAIIKAEFTEPRGELEIPQVVLVAPLRPSAGSAHAERLEYPSLEASILRHRPFTDARERLLLSAAPGTLQWERASLELKKQTLLESAWALQQFSEPEAQLYWSKKFTEASIAIYGSPDRDIALELARQQLLDLSGLTAHPHVNQERLQRVLAFYEQHSDKLTPNKDIGTQNDTALRTIAEGVRDYYQRHFGRALDAIVNGDSVDILVGPEEVVQRFSRALKALQTDYPMWDGWQAVLQDSGSISVQCSQRSVFVGRRRVPLRLGDLPATFVHEALVHGLRQLNANTLGDRELIRGLPGYIDADEGIAVLAGYAMSGVLPQKGMHKYVDISFAMGLFDTKQVPRQELFEMALDRQLVIDESAGLPIDVSRTVDSVWEYVNRIYRGTRGQDVVGVFTKDTCYYRGFRQIADYLIAETKRHSLDDTLNYVLSCKFDPFNEAQAAYVTAALATGMPLDPLLDRTPVRLVEK